MGSINNVERLRSRLEEGKVCMGTSVQVTDPLVSEFAAEAGSDFIWIEMEHSHMDLRAALGHIMAVRGTHAAPLVRVQSPDENIIKPYLDMCPAGIIIPMLTSARQTEQMVKACRYPPQGTRGFGPIRNMYGLDSIEEYLKIAEEQILIIAHIETIDAVRDLDAILQVPGLDGICLGRNDLSGSMNKLGQHSDPEVVAAIDTIIEKTVNSGLWMGCSIGANPQQAIEWRKKGMHWFSVGDDVGHIFDGAKAIADTLHALD